MKNTFKVFDLNEPQNNIISVSSKKKVRRIIIFISVVFLLIVFSNIFLFSVLEYGRKKFIDRSIKNYCVFVVTPDSYEVYWKPYFYMTNYHLLKHIPNLSLYFVTESKDAPIKIKNPNIRIFKTGEGNYIERMEIGIKKILSETPCKYGLMMQEDHFFIYDVDPMRIISYFKSMEKYDIYSLRICQIFGISGKEKPSLEELEPYKIGKTDIDPNLYWWGGAKKLIPSPYLYTVSHNCHMWNLTHLLENVQFSKKLGRISSSQHETTKLWANVKTTTNDKEELRFAFSEKDAIFYSHGSQNCKTTYKYYGRRGGREKTPPKSFDWEKCPQIVEANYNPKKFTFL